VIIAAGGLDLKKSANSSVNGTVWLLLLLEVSSDMYMQPSRISSLLSLRISYNRTCTLCDKSGKQNIYGA
jgi:hypothetical protein